MGADTKIEWAKHTFNPWLGCTKVSPACDRCYAETWSKRAGRAELWKGERQRTTPANWHQPMKWNDAAREAGERHRVFCASLADVFDNQVPDNWRIDLFDLIEDTPHLDWLLLTKRPQNIAKMLPQGWGDGWPNVWLGTTTENQTEFARRAPHLLDVPAIIHFISGEPLLSDLNFSLWMDGFLVNFLMPSTPPVSRIDWVIVGGETGGNARTMNPEWARSIRNKCAIYGTAFFMKQMTRKVTIPDDLMVRQVPTPRRPDPQKVLVS